MFSVRKTPCRWLRFKLKPDKNILTALDMKIQILSIPFFFFFSPPCIIVFNLFFFSPSYHFSPLVSQDFSVLRLKLISTLSGNSPSVVTRPIHNCRNRWHYRYLTRLPAGKPSCFLQIQHRTPKMWNPLPSFSSRRLQEGGSALL